MATRPRRGSAASRPISSSLPTADWRLRYLRVVQATDGDGAAAAVSKDERGAGALSTVPPAGAVGIEPSPSIQQRRIHEEAEAERAGAADSPMIVGSIPQQMAPLALRRLASQRRLMGLPPPAVQPADNQERRPQGAGRKKTHKPGRDSVRRQLEAEAKASLAESLFQEEADDEDDCGGDDSVGGDGSAAYSLDPTITGHSPPHPQLETSRRSTSLGDVLSSPSLPAGPPGEGVTTPASIASSTGSHRLSATSHGPRRHSSGLGVIFGTPSPGAPPPAAHRDSASGRKPASLEQAAAMAVREVAEQQANESERLPLPAPVHAPVPPPVPAEDATPHTASSSHALEVATALSNVSLSVSSAVAAVHRGKRGSSGTPRSTTGTSHARSDARSDTERASLSPSVDSSPPSAASALVSTGTRALHGSTASSSSVSHQARHAHRAQGRGAPPQTDGDAAGAFPGASASSGAWSSSTSARIRGLSPHPQAGSSGRGGVAKISSSLPSDESPRLGPLANGQADTATTAYDAAEARVRRGSASSSDTAGLASATAGHDPYAAVAGAYGAFAVGPGSVGSSTRDMATQHDLHGNPVGAGGGLEDLPSTPTKPCPTASPPRSTPTAPWLHPSRARAGDDAAPEGYDARDPSVDQSGYQSPRQDDEEEVDVDDEDEDEDDDGVRLVFGDAEGLQGTSGAWSNEWQPQSGQSGAGAARGHGQGMGFIPPHELALGATAGRDLPGRPPE